MTTYRWPADMGGGEHEEYRPVSGADSTPPTGTVAFLRDGYLVCVAVGLLTEVKPPLPAEPPIGSVVTVDGEAAQRFEDNYEADNPEKHWASVGTTQRWTWAQVCGLGEVVLLIPDPFQTVTLPWGGTQSNDAERVVVDRYDAANVSLVLAGRATAWFPLDTAREVALALWAAADAKAAQW